MAIDNTLKGWKSFCIHITALPVFFLSFVLLFNPATMGEASFSEFYAGHYTLNTIILTVILLASVALVRMIFTFLCEGAHIHVNWFAYTLWCALEMVVASQFMTLYTSLMVSLPYLQASMVCMKLAVTILVFPYLIIALAEHCRELSHRNALPADDSLIRFHDENRKLKFTIASRAVLYLQSDENYVDIHYLEAGAHKKFTLRNSMKSVEQVTAAHGLVRCHRRYIINPGHITVLKKEAEGVILAELDLKGLGSVPISKRYYESLSDMLK